MEGKPSCFIRFDEDVSHVELPERFNYPFYYQPHKLCKIAVAQIQNEINALIEMEHRMSETARTKVIGKMFGVLVVQSPDNELGFFVAFSGKIAGQNHHTNFAPPVFDMLREDGFFKKGENQLNAINAEIKRLETSAEFLDVQNRLTSAKKESDRILSEQRAVIKTGKKTRKRQREEALSSLTPMAYSKLEAQLVEQSKDDQFRHKRLVKYWREQIDSLQIQLDQQKSSISVLKEKRQLLSASIQRQLFEQYQFLNYRGKRKSLLAIFEETKQMIPPSGAGECAAPKLLQYAYEVGFKPISIAEFWCGPSPKSEVRKHGQFYPSCRGKCAPILSHMLSGLNVDRNPMLINPAEGKELEIVYEDEHLLVVDKPAEFLSAPGKTITDSVYSRMKRYLPDSTGPLLAHRLDMSTSGLLLIAKSKEIHKKLQQQFADRRINKRYTALLEGELSECAGEVYLPLRVDLENRPSQLVCYEHGKKAHTRWELVEVKNGRSLVRFYPITGRTHQLRVHAAHQNGLNAPIVGDDLYGIKTDRLHLHADELSFFHPTQKRTIKVVSEVPF